MVPQCENPSVQSISRETDLAWLAGIFDGEGALAVKIGTTRSGPEPRPRLEYTVRVYNTDVRMISKISEIYVAHNLRFYYNLNRKRSDRWKDQVGICIAYLGSCLKILQATLPYLVNKREIAQKMLDVLSYVKQFDVRRGHASYPEYSVTPEFAAKMKAYDEARLRWIEASTTKRHASEALVRP